MHACNKSPPKNGTCINEFLGISEHWHGRKVEKKELKKIKSTSGTQTHNLLLPGQVHYHCAMRELQIVRRQWKCVLIQCVRDYSDS